MVVKEVEITRKLNSSEPGKVDPVVIRSSNGEILKKFKFFNRRVDVQ
jgi:hypothetical protein